MTYVLGVDGGASKTHALVADERGCILGFGSAGCANHQVAGLPPAIGEIERAASEAIAAAGLSPQVVERGCFCLAGADLEEDYLMLTEAMQSLQLAQEISVKNDTMAALRAGLTKPWGAAVICGTGFNAAARGRDGRELILPGLGFISGDWGGGGQLSHEIIRLVMRAWDGRGAKTQLTERVLAQLGAPSEEALLRRLYREEIRQRQLLQLVPVLFEVAEAGDEPAQQLIITMGKEVAITANALLKRLGLLDHEVEVVLAGGVFKGQGSLLIDTVREEVHKEAPHASIRRLHYAPVVGAVLLALEGAGVAPDGALYQTLERSLPEQLKHAEREYSQL